MEERRQYTRFNDKGNVILRLEYDVSRGIKADLVDISSLGMGVVTQENIEIGTKVAFELMTELWDAPVTGEGKVIYIKETEKEGKKVFRIGIDFVKVEEESIRCIINLLQKDICFKARKKGV